MYQFQTNGLFGASLPNTQITEKPSDQYYFHLFILFR